MDLVNQLAEQYAAKYSSPENDLLCSIHTQTAQQHPHAHMLSGHVQGNFLAFISSILQPKFILEIGTFTGYSALCLAKGLATDGQLHTIELRAEDATTAQQNFDKSQFHNQLHLHLGNAVEIIPTLNHTWDLVFIDADKTAYTDYYEMVVPRLSERGIILADNVLFHGQVLDEEIKGKNAKAIDAFNQHVANDKRTEQVLLTLRDGLLMIKKKTG
jgi:caffeoyl-CoA O-methyltransferase